ncbi:efflux RND transporter periplasmic adaptor subunit [Phreatobacter stygius]|nr:HlyD family efflux transporter periplasmic adaptor subunit [Phreatobacter stygius]
MRLPIMSLLLLLGLMVAPVAAHPGHDEAAPPPPGALAPRADAVSAAFELVIVRRGETLELTLDDFRTNEPITDAEIALEGPGGAVNAVKGRGAQAEAWLVPAPWARQPGSHELLFTVTARGETEIMTATLVIPDASPGETPAARGSWLVPAAFANGLRERIGSRDGSLYAIIGGSFAAGFLAAALLVRRRRSTAAVVVLGIGLALASAGDPARADGDAHAHAHAAAPAIERDVAIRLPDGAVFVPKTTQRILGVRTLLVEQADHGRSVELPARVIPDPNSSGNVQAAVAGRLSAPPGGFPRLGTRVQAGDVLGFVTPPLTSAEASDQRQRAAELDQQITLAETRLARSIQMGPAAPRVQADELRIEIQGLRERRARLDRFKREPETLVAPVGGVIASANAVAGQIADPATLIFLIVDPAKLWVEALSFDMSVGERGATMRTAEGRSQTLSYRGSGFADRNQAIPVHFAIEGEPQGLRLGQLVTVAAESGDRRSGLAVPRAAVLRGQNGQTIVYVKTTGERFEPREIRVEPLDGERVIVVAGLAPDMRVVTRGAELLNQVR